jgi:hypothetical protein
VQDRDLIDPHELNAAVERSVASFLRHVVLAEVERLGVADHPDLTCIPGFRAYLRRYDDALAACEEQEDPPVRTPLRLVG